VSNTKKCKKCNKIKILDDFHNRKKSLDGKVAQCKVCMKIYNSQRYKIKKEKIRANNKNWRIYNKNKVNGIAKSWRNKNKKTVSRIRKKYRESNKEKISLATNEWRRLNQGYIKEYSKKYYKANRKDIIAKNSKRHMERYRSDIDYRIKHSLRRRLNNAIRKNQKAGSTIGYLGCSIKELKIYLELKFVIGMTWDNYGEWHIDHIRPLASFDLTDEKQYREACHYTNLQPLWAVDNLRKGSKVL